MSIEENENKLSKEIRQLYDPELSQQEADEGARNLVGLFEVLLEIHEGAQNHAAHQ